MQSNIHGYWRLKRFDNLLVVQVFEGWNESAFVQFAKELEVEIRSMNSDKWAYIADARLWGLAVPDSQSSLEELYLGVTGLVCNVTVVAKTVQQMAIEKMRTPEENAIAPHFFAECIATALDKAQGYEISVDRAAIEAWFAEGLNDHL